MAKLPPFFSRFLDYIYPPHCYVCEVSLVESGSLCGECEDQLLRVERPFCERCGECFEGELSEKFDCPNCRDIEHAFDFAVAGLRNSQVNRGFVHGLKYKRQRHLAPMMAQLMVEKFREDERFRTQQWMVVPIPLHWSRQWKRHFNQAEDLAYQFSKMTDLPMGKMLRRVRRTPTQTRLNRAGRLENLHQAFRVRESFQSEENLNVILIDDVLTTGSTAHECAKTLKHEANVQKVVVLTLLRG